LRLVAEVELLIFLVREGLIAVGEGPGIGILVRALNMTIAAWRCPLS
jgi:hypothetical protein